MSLSLQILGISTAILLAVLAGCSDLAPTGSGTGADVSSEVVARVDAPGADVSPTDAIDIGPDAQVGPACGNGTCQAGENPDNCPQDCENPCGNGDCEKGENPFNCPEDCESVCGNGECEFGEDPEGCPQDCENPCGNGDCEEGENPFNCPQDCEHPCGDGECDAGEDPTSCPVDCAPPCGDGVCDPGEQGTCPKDCCTDCADGLDCTEGKCSDEGKACTQVVKEGYCLVNNTCFNGGDAAPSTPCLTCQPAVEKSAWTPADGTPCDDGDPCTVGTVCDEGVCIGEALQCDDGNPCTQDWCDPEAGCTSNPQPGACDDGDPCTKDEACLGGECVGIQYSCDDDLACTQDQCLGDGTCEHIQSSATCLVDGFCFDDAALHPGDPCLVCNAFLNNKGWSHQDLVPCDDIDTCTENDICWSGICVGQPVTCPQDDDPCTESVCSNPFGCDAVFTDASCDDGDACTASDACSDGQCTGSAVTCDDQDLCTDDACAPDTGCVFTFNSVPCDDGDACTLGDACTEGQCAGAVIDCDDDDACTEDYCQGGLCLHVDITEECDDGNACTNDWCTPATGCVHEHNDAPCDDGSYCTLQDQCVEGACIGGVPPDCDDDIACTTDYCVPSKGCVHNPNDATCNDQVVCTDDSCSLEAGCVNLPNDAVCDDVDPCTEGLCTQNGCAVSNLCTIQVFDTANDLLRSANIRDVMVYDSTRDPLGSGWKSGVTSGWGAEANEQFAGRSVVFPGDIEEQGGPLYSPCTMAGTSASSLELPVQGPQYSSDTLTLELWIRFSPLLSIYSFEGCSSGIFFEWHPDLILGVSDGSILDPFSGVQCGGSSGDYCNGCPDASSMPRLEVLIESGVDTSTYEHKCMKENYIQNTQLRHRCCYTGGGGCSQVWLDGVALPVDQWAHVAIVADGSSGQHRSTTVYLNGTPVGTTSVTGQVSSDATNLRIWTSLNSGHEGAGTAPPFDVAVDDVKLYLTALDQATVQQHRQQDLNGSFDSVSNGAVKHWTFDHGSESFLLHDNARLSDRSARQAFPQIAYLVASEQGLDILDGKNGDLWMAFEQDDLGRSILSSGVGYIDGLSGFLSATGGSQNALYGIQLNPTGLNLCYLPWGGYFHYYPCSAMRAAPCLERLTCAEDTCLDPGQTDCACSSSAAYETVACRNRETWSADLLEDSCIQGTSTGLAMLLSPTDPLCLGNDLSQYYTVSTWQPGGIVVTTDKHEFHVSQTLPPDPWTRLTLPRAAGDTLYVVAQKADLSCTRVAAIDDYLGKELGTQQPGDECTLECSPEAGWSCFEDTSFYAGSLLSSWEGDGPSCGTPAETIHDLVVTEGTSVVNPVFNTLYLALERSIAVVHEANHEPGGPDDALTIRWSALGGGGAGYKILPDGPYTAIQPCGGYIYVGTSANGIVALDVEAPVTLLDTYSQPTLPSNQIRALSCTEEGPAEGLHRILAATPEGAVEIVAASK